MSSCGRADTLDLQEVVFLKTSLRNPLTQISENQRKIKSDSGFFIHADPKFESVFYFVCYVCKWRSLAMLRMSVGDVISVRCGLIDSDL